MFNELLENVMNLGIITADDVKRLTAIELMMLIIERTNGLLNHVEIIDEKLVNLLETIRTITIEELNKWKEDGTFDVLINQTALKMVNDRIDETNAHLSEVDFALGSLNVNVLRPLNNLSPLVPNINDIDVAKENTKRLNAMLDFFKNQNVTLFFPKGNYYLVPQIRVKSNVRFLGDSTRDGSTIHDISGKNEYNSLFLFSVSDDDVEDWSKNRLWGGHIKDLQIVGNKQNHHCLELIKTGWEGKLEHVSISNFRGSAIKCIDVFDTVYDKVTIFDCGGKVGNNINYAIDLDRISNITNAQHFNILHMEDCRYMINFNGDRHVYFVNSKFEQNNVNDDNVNPVFKFAKLSREVVFQSCMFALDHPSKYPNGSPYVIEGVPGEMDSVTKFIGCDFATGNAEGVKLLNTNGGYMIFDDCLICHLYGASESFVLDGGSTLNNCKIISRVLADGSCQPFKIGKASINNVKFDVSGGDSPIETAHITLSESNFYISNVSFHERISCKVNNPNKCLGKIERNSGTIPNYSTSNPTIDLGKNFYNVIKLNPTTNMELTHITNYCMPGEEVIIYNTSGDNKITVKHNYGGFVSNTGQIATKTEQDVVLGGNAFIVLKWTGMFWNQIV